MEKIQINKEKQSVTKKPINFLAHQLQIANIKELPIRPGEHILVQFQRLANFIGQHSQINNEDLLDAAVEISAYLDFPVETGDASTVIRAKFTPVLPTDGFTVIELQTQGDSDYRRSIGLIRSQLMNESLKNKYGAVLILPNGSSEQKKERFVLLSSALLIGYIKLIHHLFDEYNQAPTFKSRFSWVSFQDYLRDFLITRNRMTNFIHRFDDQSLGDQPESEIKDVFQKVDWVKSYQHNQMNNFLRAYFFKLRQSMKLIERNDETVSLDDSVQRSFRTVEISQGSLIDQTFSYVKFDDKFSTTLWYKFIQGLKIIQPYLPNGHNKPGLHLERHSKREGSFDPYRNEICLDMTSASNIAALANAGLRSFLHQYGHYLDYQYADEPLSLSYEFQPLLDAYQKMYYRQFRQMNYVPNSSGVFARLFEYYYYLKGIKSPLMRKQVDYQTVLDYQFIDESMACELILYFDHKFKTF